MLHDENMKTLQLIISQSVWCLCENSTLYKYQVTPIVFF